MMIFGHELGHFAYRDHLRGIGRGLALRFVVAVFAGDGGALVNVAAAIASNLSKAQFIAIRKPKPMNLAYNSWFPITGHTAGAAEFSQRLARQSRLDIALLSTHPAPGDRSLTLTQTIAQHHYPIQKIFPLITHSNKKQSIIIRESIIPSTLDG